MHQTIIFHTIRVRPDKSLRVYHIYGVENFSEIYIFIKQKSKGTNALFHPQQYHVF